MESNIYGLPPLYVIPPLPLPTIASSIRTVSFIESAITQFILEQGAQWETTSSLELRATSPASSHSEVIMADEVVDAEATAAETFDLNDKQRMLKLKKYVDTSIKTHVCMICRNLGKKRAYSFKQGLARHMRLVHPDIPRSKIPRNEPREKERINTLRGAKKMLDSSLKTYNPYVCFKCKEEGIVNAYAFKHSLTSHMKKKHTNPE